MSTMSLEALLRTVSEQEAQIVELKRQVVWLQSLLENQRRLHLAQELVQMVCQYPDKLDRPMVVSTEIH